MGQRKRPIERMVVLNEKYADMPSVLGLDCSSSTVGWGLISLDIELLAYGHFKPLKPSASCRNLIERLDDAFIKTQELCLLLNPNHVSIEEIIYFMNRNTTARTITTLASFNRCISLAAHKSTGNVKLHTVLEIRNRIKRRYGIRTRIDKYRLPDIIRKNLSPEFYDTINTKNNIAKETYDEADGIATAWSYVIYLNALREKLENEK